MASSWEQRMHDAAALAESGRGEEAVLAFHELLGLDDVPETAKGMCACNIALLHRGGGNVDTALEWYEHARTYGTEAAVVALETKAGYLAELGRHHEAVATYELLAGSDAPEDARRRAAEAVAQLRGA